MYRTVHKLTLAVITGALAVSVAVAQDTSSAPQTATAPSSAGQMGQHHHSRDYVAMRIANLSKTLSLSDDQKAKLTPIIQDEQKQIQATRTDSSLTPQQKRERLQQLRKTTHGLIAGVLTPEQQSKFNQPVAGKNAVEWMSAKLNLTDDQKSKIGDLFNSQSQQLKAVQQDSSLSVTEKRAKVREIRESTHKQVLSLLTPEQAEKMGQMRGHARGKHGRGHRVVQTRNSRRPPLHPLRSLNGLNNLLEEGSYC